MCLEHVPVFTVPFWTGQLLDLIDREQRREPLILIVLADEDADVTIYRPLANNP